jgi:hypothetical protein
MITEIFSKEIDEYQIRETLHLYGRIEMTRLLAAHGKTT